MRSQIIEESFLLPRARSSQSEIRRALGCLEIGEEEEGSGGSVAVCGEVTSSPQGQTEKEIGRMRVRSRSSSTTCAPPRDIRGQIFKMTIGNVVEERG